MLLGAHHVPECLCGGPCLQRGAMTIVRPSSFYVAIKQYRTARHQVHLCLPLKNTKFKKKTVVKRVQTFSELSYIPRQLCTYLCIS